jgi:hypothetical protein
MLEVAEANNLLDGVAIVCTPKSRGLRHQEMKMDQKSGIFTSLSAAVYF